MGETEFQNPNKDILKQVWQINKKLNCLAEKSILEKLSHEEWKTCNSHIPA